VIKNKLRFPLAMLAMVLLLSLSAYALPKTDESADPRPKSRAQVHETESSHGDFEDALSAVPWDELRAALSEVSTVLDEVDTDEIRREIEEAMAEIDLEEIHLEARAAMEGVDWEGIRQEIEDAHAEIKDAHLEDVHREVREAMDSVDWEEIHQEIEDAQAEMEDVYLEDIELHVREAMEAVDWEEIRRTVEEATGSGLEALDAALEALHSSDSGVI